MFASSICHRFKSNKTPAQALTPPADEKKMGTIWIFVYYAVYGLGRGRCRNLVKLVQISENSTLDVITPSISGLNSLTVGVFPDLVGDCTPKIIETLTG